MATLYSVLTYLPESEYTSVLVLLCNSISKSSQRIELRFSMYN